MTRLADDLPLIGACCACILALAAVARRRHNVSHWSFAAAMALMAFEAATSGTTKGMTSVGAVARWEQWRMIVISFQPGAWLVFSLCYARGSRLDYLRKWRWPVAVAILLPIALAFAFREQQVASVKWDYTNARWVVLLDWAGMATYGFVLVSAVVSLMNFERTFRAAVGTTRWRIKFMLLGVAVLLVVRIYTSSQEILFRSVGLPLEWLNSVALVLATVLIARSFFRAGNFDVDVYPSHSVLQGSITVLLAGVYLVLVGALAKVATYLGGDASFALKAFVGLVALVVFAIVLQSDLARLRLRQFVSRNFQRPIYDYRAVWTKFTASSSSRVEQADLCRSLARLIAETFQALSVAIWVVDEKRESIELAASTFLSETLAPQLRLDGPEGMRLVDQLQVHAKPVDIELIESDWAASLRRLHPNQFQVGGHRICVPLVSHGEFIGLIIVGDRVGGAEFAFQDFDMLSCVGDHVTAGLRNAQLSRKLLQAKELEAFQTMATFFVHDLKNAASTLNLMLQNLPEHFDDPAFREDSLRGISKTVTHINSLTRRLSLLRHEQAFQMVDSDLNSLVESALAGLQQGAGSILSRDLRPVPRVQLDPEQFSKVVTNLVLNATEAVSAAGRVTVATGVETSWVVLTVADNGSGMSAEFLSRGLFRPFQTTKKSGLGIGMFQTKMIVEAHGGRISVASLPGEGTTFQVFLPVPKTHIP
jgi:putative PEP-CTERM system histidine kinase